MGSVLVDPTGASKGPTPGAFSLAPRRRDLAGTTVGLLANTKYNSDTLLDAIGELLRERYGVARLVAERKPYFGRPLPEEMATDLASRCDAVVTAIGD
ncbi:MAG TPA: hypothetical protein VFD49_22505 [Candidatus Dormibacteraeota bacterium]|nr:hypothetical protein [Candidatus Dormibacteraeota bacterium]